MAGKSGGRITRRSGVRHLTWVYWKTDDAAGHRRFDDIAGCPPDRRSSGPYESGWSHHAEWYCETRREADEIAKRIRNRGEARVEVFDYPTEENRQTIKTKRDRRTRC